MTKKENARPGAGTPRRVEMGADFASHVPYRNSIMSGGGGQMRIAPLLSHGVENAVPLRDLKQMVNRSGREVRRLIQSERLQGIPILSDNLSGYYLPGDDQERRAFVRSMRGRAAEIVAVAEAVEQAEDNYVRD